MKELSLMEAHCVAGGDAALAHDVLEFGGACGAIGAFGGPAGAAIGGLIGAGVGVVYYLAG